MFNFTAVNLASQPALRGLGFPLTGKRHRRSRGYKSQEWKPSFELGEIMVFVFLLSIFAHTLTPIRALSRAYPRSLPLTPAHSHTLLHVLMHKY